LTVAIAAIKVFKGIIGTASWRKFHTAQCVPNSAPKVRRAPTYAFITVAMFDVSQVAQLLGRAPGRLSSEGSRCTWQQFRDLSVSDSVWKSKAPLDPYRGSTGL